MSEYELCQCGHIRGLHHRADGYCVAIEYGKPLSWWCGCQEFRKAANDG